jgi:hypothetical protein
MPFGFNREPVAAGADATDAMLTIVLACAADSPSADPTPGTASDSATTPATTATTFRTLAMLILPYNLNCECENFGLRSVLRGREETMKPPPPPICAVSNTCKATAQNPLRPDAFKLTKGCRLSQGEVAAHSKDKAVLVIGPVGFAEQFNPQVGPHPDQHLGKVAQDDRAGIG